MLGIKCHIRQKGRKKGKKVPLAQLTSVAYFWVWFLNFHLVVIANTEYTKFYMENCLYWKTSFLYQKKIGSTPGDIQKETCKSYPEAPQHRWQQLKTFFPTLWGERIGQIEVKVSEASRTMAPFSTIVYTIWLWRRLRWGGTLIGLALTKTHFQLQLHISLLITSLSFQRVIHSVC